MFRKMISAVSLTMPVKTFGNCVFCHLNHSQLAPLRLLLNRTSTVEHSHQIARTFQMSHCLQDLMEFFDDKKNWGETQVRSGRSWRHDELRIKSNSDLHKLWFVLLKERNMLLTMEAECKRQVELFPTPERLDKVEESMKNLETVVRERNRAYHLLETGETGERPGAEEENFLGLQEYRQFEEYTVPKEENKQYLLAKLEEPKVSRKEKAWFILRWKEKQRKERRKRIRGQQYEVIQCLQKFPDLDVEALKEKYPDVNVDDYVERFLKGKHQGNLISSTIFVLLWFSILFVFTH